MNNSTLKENSLIQNSQNNTSYLSLSKYGTPMNRSPDNSFILNNASTTSFNLGNRKSDYKIESGKTLQDSQQRVVLLACEVERLTEVNVKLVKENEIFRATNEKSQREKDLEFKLGLVLAENEKLNELVEKLSQTPEQFEQTLNRENMELRSKIQAAENRASAALEQLRQVAEEGNNLREVTEERDRLKVEKKIAEEQFNGMRMKMNEIIGQNYLLNQEKQKLLKAIQELDEMNKAQARSLRGSVVSDVTLTDEGEKEKRSGLGQQSEAKFQLRTLAEEIAKYRKQVSELEKENQSLRSQAEKGRDLEESCNKLREIVDQLAPKAQQTDSLTTRVRELEREKESLRGNVEQMKEGIENARRGLEKANEENLIIEERGKKIEALLLDNEKLNSVLAKINQDLNDQRAVNDTLLKDNYKLTAAIAKLGQEGEEKSAKIEALIKETDKLNASVAKLTLDFDDKSFKNAQLTAQLLEKKGVEGQLTSVKDRSSTLAAQNEDLKKRIQELEAEVQNSKQHIQLLLEESRQLKEALLENASLKKKLETASNDMRLLANERTLYLESLTEKSKELEIKENEVKSQAQIIEDLQAMLKESETNREHHYAAASDNYTLLEKSRKKLEELLKDNEDLKTVLTDRESERDNLCTLATRQQEQLNEDLEKLHLLNDQVQNLQIKLNFCEEQKEQQVAKSAETQRRLEESEVKVVELTRNFEEVQVKLAEIEKNLLSQRPDTEPSERYTVYYEPTEQFGQGLERILRSSKVFSNERYEMENLLKAKEHQINELEAQVMELLNEKSRLQIKLNEAERAFAENQQVLLDGLSRELQQLNKTVGDLKKVSDEKTALVEAKNKELDAKDSEIAQLKQEIDSIKPSGILTTVSDDGKNTMSEAQSIPLKDLMNDLDQNLLAELEDQKSKLAVAFKDNAFLTKLIGEKDADVERLKKQVTDLSIENSLIPGLEMRNKTVHEELQKALKEIDDLKIEGQRQRRKSIDQNSIGIELERTKQQLQILLDENEKLNSNLEKQFADLEQMRVKLLEAERSALLIEPLQEKVNKLIADIAHKNSEIEASKKKIEELEPKSRDYEDLKKQMAAQISDNARLFEEKQVFKRDIEAVKSIPIDLIAAAEEKKQLNVKVFALADEVTTLNDVLTKELYEKEKTRALIEGIALECENYKKRIFELAKENESLSANLQAAIEENEKMYKTPRQGEPDDEELQAKVKFLNVDIAAQNNIIEGLKKKVEENQKLSDEAETHRLAANILKKEKDHMSRLLHEKLVEIESLKGQILEHARGNAGMEQLQTKVKTLNEEVQKLNEVLVRKAKECETLYEEVKKSKATAGEGETLKVVNNMLSDENIKLRTSNSELMIELNNLRKKVGEYSYKSPSTNVSPISDPRIKTLNSGYGEKKNF